MIQCERYGNRETEGETDLPPLLHITNDFDTKKI